MVFGDFDADGLTGLAILVLALRRLGVDAIPYVPSRLEEGHGLSLRRGRRRGERRVRADRDGRHAARRASRRSRRPRAAGSTSSSPTTTASRPCCRPPSRSSTRIAPTPPIPDRRLAGSGVAFTVARLLLGEPGGAEAEALELADLATIGTVADLVPCWARTGRSSSSGWSGCGRAPARDRRPPGPRRRRRGRRRPRDASASHSRRGSTPPVGWGRRSTPRGCCSPTTDAEAAALAAVLEAANRTRRDLMRTAIAEARAAPVAAPARRLEARDATPDGRPVAPRSSTGRGRSGIVGLVAVAARGRARAARHRRRGPRATSIRASCRSDGRLHLGAALDACADLLIRHGGHAGAAGFEIAAERWPSLRRAVPARSPRRPPRRTRGRPLALDLALRPRRRLRPAPRPRPARPVRRRATRSRSSPSLASPSRASAPPTAATPSSCSSATSTSSTASRSGGRISPTAVSEGDRVDVVARLREPPLRRARVAPARGPRRRDVGCPSAGAARSWTGAGGGRRSGQVPRRRARPAEPHDRRRATARARAAAPPGRDPYGLLPRACRSRPRSRSSACSSSPS